MQLNFDKPFFKTNKFYRLEIVRSIVNNNNFNTLRVNFYPFPDLWNLNKIKHYSKESLFTYFTAFGKTPSEKSVFVDIDTAYLYPLVPGSVWLAKSDKTIKKVFLPSSSQKIIFGNQISKTSFGYEKYKLEEHAQFGFLKKSHSLSLIKDEGAVLDNQRTTVLIPDSEIIRHYFSASKYFMNQLFSEDPIADNAELVGSVEDNTEICTIKLNSRYFRDNDAPFIARALLDNRAMLAMREIYSNAYQYHNEFSNNGHEPEELPLKSSLPFSGTTQMEVIGHYVSYSSSPKRVFLVRQIKSCNKEWPFSGLKIISADSYSNNSSNEYEHREVTAPVRVNEGSANLNVGSQPSANQTEIIIESNQFGRFPFLDNLHIEKVREDSEASDETVSVITTTTDDEKLEDLIQSSLDKENYKQNNTLNPSNIDRKNSSREIVPFVEISQVFFELETENEDWVITAMPISYVDQSVPFGYCEFKGSKWASLGGCNRKGLFLRIATSSGVAYFLEIEPVIKRAGMYCFSGVKEIINDEFALRLLDSISQSNGKYIKRTLSESFNEVKRLNHTNVGSSLKNRIHKKILELVKTQTI